MTDFSRLNPDDFKRWMKSQDDFDSSIKKDLLGLTAETKLSAKRISKNMTVENGKSSKMAKEFVENGGVVKGVLEKDYLIEVHSGCFYINKKYVIV